MPNLSPREQREKYTLYDNKAAFGAEAAKVYELWHNNWKQSVTGYRQIEVTITNP
jgi:hypothetical protein